MSYSPEIAISPQAIKDFKKHLGELAENGVKNSELIKLNSTNQSNSSSPEPSPDQANHNQAVKIAVTELETNQEYLAARKDFVNKVMENRGAANGVDATIQRGEIYGKY